MSLKYVLLSVLDLLETELSVDSSYCKIMKDSRPPAFSGEYFYSIHGKDEVITFGAGEGAIMKKYSFTVSVTQRSTIVPTDEQGLRSFLSTDLPTTVTAEAISEIGSPIYDKLNAVVAAIVANKETLLNNMNGYCTDDSGPPFISVPDLVNYAGPTEVGTDHFWSGDMDDYPTEQIKGFLAEVTFSNIERPFLLAEYA